MLLCILFFLCEFFYFVGRLILGRKMSFCGRFKIHGSHIAQGQRIKEEQIRIFVVHKEA